MLINVISVSSRSSSDPNAGRGGIGNSIQVARTKILTLPNIICTPHIGAQTKEAQTLAANVIAEKIIMILRGVF